MVDDYLIWPAFSGNEEVPLSAFSGKLKVILYEEACLMSPVVDRALADIITHCPSRYGHLCTQCSFLSASVIPKPSISILGTMCRSLQELLVCLGWFASSLNESRIVDFKKISLRFYALWFLCWLTSFHVSFHCLCLAYIPCSKILNCCIQSHTDSEIKDPNA